MGWAFQFAPTGAFTLEANVIFSTYALALAYAKTDPTAVVGKVISVDSGDDKGVYMIEAVGADGSLKKVGSDIDLSNYVTKDQLTNIYTYKGSKATYEELPVLDVKVGDVWNVETAYENHPAGTNWAWNGSSWDALAGSVDLSTYALKSEVEALSTNLTTSINGVAADLALTNQEVAKKVNAVDGHSLISAEKLALIDTNASDIQALENQNLDSRVATLEGMFKDGDNNIDLSGISASITDHTNRIVALESDNTNHKSNITTLQGQVQGHGERLTAIENLNTEQSTQISGLTTRVEAVEAHGTAISNLTTTVNGHTDLISGLRTDLNSEISNRETAVNDAKTHAETKAGEALEAAKTYVGEELAKLSYDAAGSAAAVEVKLNEEIARAQAAEKANADAIVVERGRIDALLTSEGVSEAVESFKELQVWIENHEGGAADILEAANKAQEEVDALELVVSAMDEAYKAADTVALNAAKAYTDEKFVTLGSAAYEDKSAFATAAQGALAETAAQQANTYTKTEVDGKISDAFSWINV